MKIIKKKKGVLVVTLCMAVICAFVVYMLKPSEVTLATEIKLRTYESLNNGNEIQSAADLNNTQKVKNWAMDIVSSAFKEERISVSQDEYKQISSCIVRNLKTTMEAGNIQTDESGALTDLSKSYISNAVANAISYAAPSVDLNASVDSGTTQYEQVLNMQKTLNSLQTSNNDLKKSVQNVNNMYSFLKNFGATTTSSVNESAVEERMDALYTLLTAQSNANKSTGNAVASNSDEQVATTITELTQTQSQILSDLQTSMTDIQKITEEISSIKEVDESTKKEISQLQEDISSLQGTIESTKQQFSELIKKTEATLRAEASANKQELTGSITSVQTSLQQSINDNYQKLESALNSAISKIEKEAGTTNEDVKKQISETKSSLEEKIQLSQASVEKLLSEKMKELSDAEQSDKEELQKNISDVQNALSDELEKSNEELKKQMGDSLDLLDEKLQKLDVSLHKAVEDAKSELNLTIEEKANDFTSSISALEERVEANEQAIQLVNQEIEALKDKYDKAIEELWKQVNANTAAIEALQKRVDSYIAAADAHSKIDVIEGFVINADDWVVDGSNATYVVQNEYFKSCVLAEVDYRQQYDITPSYTVDTEAGTLAITIEADQVSTIEVADIVCYHNSTDVVNSDEQQGETDSENKADSAPEPEDPNNLNNEETISNGANGTGEDNGIQSTGTGNEPSSGTLNEDTQTDVTNVKGE